MKNLRTVLMDSLSKEDLIDLGLINPIIAASSKTASDIAKEISQTDLEILKFSLSAYDEYAEDFGISYTGGSLVNDDEPTHDELVRATELDLPVAEQAERKNFWYISKEYNRIDNYTRYVLANGEERIVYDDELANNSSFKYNRELSDAREDGEFEKYNQLKKEYKSKFLKEYKPMEIEQVFLETEDGIELGDIINVSEDILTPSVSIQYEDEDGNELRDSDGKQIRNKNKTYKKLEAYLMMISDEFRKCKKINQKIKIKNINNNLICVL